MMRTEWSGVGFGSGKRKSSARYLSQVLRALCERLRSHLNHICIVLYRKPARADPFAGDPIVVEVAA